MESTSYSKIPADVKSTLGSELITKSVTDSWTGNGVTVNEASTEQAFSGTQSLKFVTGSGGGHKGVTSNSFTSVLNALYKIDFYVYTTDSDIEIRVYQGDGSGTSLNESISVASNQWVNVVKYYIEDGGGSFSSIAFGNNTTGVTTYIDNISVKKVTNDLVAYYPLDGDSSRGNGTDNVVTGEVLGSELLTSYDFTDTTQWNQVSNVTRTSATSITATANNGTIRTLTSSFESTTKLYKINIEGSVTTGNIDLKSWGGQETYKTGITGTFNETVYANTSYGGLMIVLTANTAVATITSLSIKEVTSNTGVLL